MYNIHIQTEPRKNWRIHWHCVDFVAGFSCFSPVKTACILVYSLSRSLWKAVPPYSILTALPSQVSSVKSLTDVRFTSLKFPRLSLFRCDSHEKPPLIITVFLWSSAQNNLAMTSSQLPQHSWISFLLHGHVYVQFVYMLLIQPVSTVDSPS